MKTYMIGVTLIEARNEEIAKRKYNRLTAKLRKAKAREGESTRKWLDKPHTKLALKRLTSGK